MKFEIDDEKTRHASLTLSLPGVGIPSPHYHSFSGIVSRMNIGIKCGLHTGNSCHFMGECADKLSYVTGETMNV